MIMTIPLDPAVLISYYEITIWIVWTDDISDWQALVHWSVLIMFTVSSEDVQIPSHTSLPSNSIPLNNEAVHVVYQWPSMLLLYEVADIS